MRAADAASIAKLTARAGEAVGDHDAAEFCKHDVEMRSPGFVQHQRAEAAPKIDEEAEEEPAEEVGTQASQALYA